MNPNTNARATRRLVLVELYWTRDKDPRVPLGHASLRAAVQQVLGLEVRSITQPVNPTPPKVSDLATQILDGVGGGGGRECDVALGAYVWAEETIQALLPELRRRGFAGRIVLGGPQISYTDGGLEDLYPDADLFIRGYGELALQRLASGDPPAAIPGVHSAGGVDLAAQAQVNLEVLPSPWLSGLIPLETQRFVRWETQRGCPFRCAFCQHREPGARLPNAELNEGRIQAEIDLFCASGVQEIAVLDPIFNTSRWCLPILNRFKMRRFSGRLSLQCRLELITPEFLEALDGLDVLLEFGLQTTQKAEMKAIRRMNHLGKADVALAAVRERGIPHEVSLIFGLPEQTLHSFRASLGWCLERQIPVIKAFPLMLLRGTSLARDKDRWGLVEEGGPMPCVVASNTFSREDWLHMQALSDQLRAMEGRHPGSLKELEAEGFGAEAGLGRWRP